MSLNADTIEYLLSKGLTAEDILEIARLTEKRVDPTAAARQARCRARKRGDDVSHRDVTRDPPIESILTPELPDTEAKASVAPGGKKRGTRIPEDWTPPAIVDLSGKSGQLAAQWPDGVYEIEAEGFLNYWLSETRAGSAKGNWGRAWANWIIRSHSRVMRDAKFGNSPAAVSTADPAKWTPEKRAEYARRWATGPPGQPIGNVVGDVVRRAGSG